MKLLLDQNLSRKLVKKIARQFPESSHVIFCNLEMADDGVIWHYAREKGFVIVTKDTDFSARSASSGFPPKVVLLRIGNVATQHVETLLKTHTKDIRDFGKNAKSGCLVLRGSGQEILYA